METDKKHRSVLRGLFTKTATVIENLLSVPVDDRDGQQISVEWELLQEKYNDLSVVENKVYEGMLANSTEEDLTKEMEAFDKYRHRYHVLKLKCDDTASNRSVFSTSSSARTNQGKRKFKLPTIELKKFNGDLKEWLPFWSQFRKVHDDPDIDLNDKIAYITQATVSGSKARQIVESFPAVSENYVKIIECLQSRFGREDLQIEVYVRELLKLVLNRVSSGYSNVSMLYDNIESQLRSLETLGITTDKYAAILYPMIESCLPEDMILLWHRSSDFLRPSSENLEEPIDEFALETRLKGLMRFMQNEVQHEQKVHLATEGFGLNATHKSVPSDLEKRTSKPHKQFVTDSLTATAAGLVNCEVAKCIFCNGQHENENCFRAQKFSIEQKRKLLSDKKACFRCLKIGHSAKKCRSHRKCIICSKSHVILMCPELPVHKTDAESSATSKADVRDTDQVLTNLTNTHVFLQTLRINIRSANGSKQVRTLIDTGSQRTYILKGTAQKMGFISKRAETIVHALFGGKNTMEQRHECYDVTVNDGHVSLSFEALDQPTICNEISPIFNGPWMGELQKLNISLSDVGDPAPIELLIGADVIGRLYTGQKYQLQCGLVAMETYLGWTLIGKIPRDSPTCSTTMLVFSLLVNDATIPNLWELDILGIKDPTEKMTRLETAKEAKSFFNETVRLNDENRYEVRLPWLTGHPPLSDNYGVANKRLEGTVTKLKRSNLFDSYNLIFQEWLSEGIIERVPNADKSKVTHYLPHRPVIKNSSDTTKIRPVFDASSHEKGRPSLNQCLEVGPNMIELIPDVLLRFRQQKIGVVSDIRKAFLQIAIHPTDRDFLRFLWINEEGEEIVFRHKRVVFGVSSSPFLLGATIEYHLTKTREECSTSDTYTKNMVDTLLNSFYVDNCVTSVPDQITLKKFITEARSMMQEAKMDLRGWESTGNSHTVVPVLGLIWDTITDSLSINDESLQIGMRLENEVITKRLMLSFAQRIFDPVGFTCPVSLFPKLLLQKLWEKRIGWDVPVDEETAKGFRKWSEELPDLLKINIPRWIQAGPGEAERWSLHTFSDASKEAYAAVVFLRVEKNKEPFIYLLAAKSRVAPLKNISIPRLELLAATIAARLYDSVRKQFPDSVESYFWSDSTTVISWIRRTEEWSIFVFNRVKEIRQLTEPDRWNHVPGSDNPADLPSRGCFGRQLVQSRWWEGPTWLYEGESCIQQNVEFDEEEICKEKKKSAITTTLLNTDSDYWHFYYFSQYTKLLRMMAWILRFCHNVKNPRQRLLGELTAEEISQAEVVILKVVQKESFEDNCKRISSLKPYTDESGLIRLKSRISERPDTMAFRLPILLPGEHPVVRKLILDFHIKSCHVGAQGLLSLLREQYWTLGGRRLVRSVIKQCGVCKRHLSKPLTVETPSLPLDRVRDARVFEVTGIDFAGPLFLKSGEKAWVCLFTCAVYRAVHLELVTSLSTNSFIQALRRFVSRRGRPGIVYSDNGTNFVGLENGLKVLDWDAIATYSSVQRIKWRFNPPTAAWWGGFWERLIGILKGLLRKVLGRACLGYEDLLTLLCECENIINSRPLTYLSDDPTDLSALTPARFLQDQVETGMPDCDVLEKTSLCRKLRHRQQLREHLQKRFRNEYLAQLKFPGKPNKPSNISVGDVVIIGHDNTKRLDWPLGKVIEVIPGKNGQIRLVRLKTAQGQLLRPLQRLHPLESIVAITKDITEEGVEESSESAGVSSESAGVSSESAGVIKSRVSESESAPIISPVSDSHVKLTRKGRLIKLPPRYH